jgi:hypothetical protein
MLYDRAVGVRLSDGELAMKAFLKAAALLLAAGTAGCATRSTDAEQAGGISVTRTHLGQAIARGQIAVEAFEPADANDPAFASYASAVGAQLQRLGWTLAPTRGQSEQVALIDVSEQGAGAGVATKLDVRLRRRSEGSLIWQGQATGEARPASSSASRVAEVQRLAEAVFRDFPGESGRTIRTR